ncbi:MAG: ABC transporter substrate-binding protein [Solirubrobacterales bacterium]
MRNSRLRALWVALALALGSIGLAACGSSSSSTDTTGGGGGGSGASIAASVKPDSAVVKLVPSDVKSSGSLTMATDASYPPMEMFASDGSTIIGVDPDLAKAITAKMGLDVNIENASFDSILTGIAAGKYDFSMSAFTDTKERQKTVDFVTYFTAGTSFYMAADSGLNVNSLDDLCGLSVAAEKGTTQATDAQAQSAKCKGQGKDGVTVSVYPDQNGANLAISGGKADVGMADSPVAAYIVKQSGGQFKLGGSYASEPYGIAIPKGSGLAPPMQAALKSLMADGTYLKILKSWGVEAGAIDNPTINGAIS